MIYPAKISIKLHIPLFTESKLFCSCKNSGGPANTNICNVCLGKFGATPYLNKSAMLLAVLAGVSLNCSISDRIVFDKAVCSTGCIPKGYRIVQYTAPVAKSGYIDVLTGKVKKRVKIKYCRLEEGYRVDEYGMNGERDFNKCGTAILTIETGYNFSGGEEVKNFLNSLYSLMHYVGASSCNYGQPDIPMELRIAVGEKAKEFGGTCLLMKVSPDEAEFAVDFEIGRQMGILDSGEEVGYEKITFDKTTKCTVPTNGHSYNFDFENTVPMRDVSASAAEIRNIYLLAVSSVIGELPVEKKQRYIKTYGLDEKTAETISSEKSFAALFEYSADHCQNPKECAFWIADELLGILNIGNIPAHALDMSCEKFASLMNLYCGRLLNADGCREILTQILINGVEPFYYAAQHGLLLVADTETVRIACRLALKKNLMLFYEYLSGSNSAFNDLCIVACGELRNMVSKEKVENVMRAEAVPEFYEACRIGAVSDEYSGNKTAFDISSYEKATELLEYVDSIPEEEPELLAKKSRTLSNYQIGLLVDNIVKRTEREIKEQYGEDDGTGFNPDYVDARPYFPQSSPMTNYFLYLQPQKIEYDEYYNGEQGNNDNNNNNGQQ